MIPASAPSPSPTQGLKRPAIVLFSALAVGNLAAWAWAFILFGDQPIMLGTALLAYTLGLRHAIDPDHIAAIDNVTRKLVAQGQRPLTTGLWFALGHSTVVIAACAVISGLAAGAYGAFATFKPIGAFTGTLIAATFLLVIGLLNLSIFLALWQTARRVRQSGEYDIDHIDALMARHGLLARFFRPLFKFIRVPWHMYPLGLLFGLGFDTATSIGLFSMAAATASDSINIGKVMVFPALFTAGMALADAADGAMMLGAYHWARKDPSRKLRYNLIITGASVLIALGIGAVQILGLLVDSFTLHGPIWSAVQYVRSHFNILGFAIIIMFAMIWGIATLVLRNNNSAHDLTKPGRAPAGK